MWEQKHMGRFYLGRDSQEAMARKKGYQEAVILRKGNSRRRDTRNNNKFTRIKFTS